MTDKVLITGALGQIGSELTPALREKYGKDNVIAFDINEPSKDFSEGPFKQGDATDKDLIESLIKKNSITHIYHLVGILSAAGEKNPDHAWHVNMQSLKHVLDLSVKHNIKKVFWPSSIAVFGETSPHWNTPQHTLFEPTTVYGVTKSSGEKLCNYYFRKFGLDVRSLRYPGLISHKTEPGGGTTDYAVEIFYDAIKKGSYECFLEENTVLPMMYMQDAITGTLQLMDADPEKISVRTSYNFSAISFSPKEIAEEIGLQIPGFTCTFKPDERQKIAESWPSLIDDSTARKDWRWKAEYDLPKMVEVMLKHLKEKLKNDKDYL